MNRSILITGAAGFIGFHTALALHAQGFKIIGIDNFNPYYSPQLKKDRALFLYNAHISVENIDICDTTAVKKLIHEHEIDLVIHLAAQAGVRYSIDHPFVYCENNLKGQLSILEALRAHPQCRLIFASSSSVYGNNKKIPFSVEDSCDRPMSFYGATKKAGEVMAYSYHSLYQIRMIGLRFFTVYGPWGRPDMAYFKFTEDILNDRTIEIYNHGKMQRDFTYIDDIVEGIIGAVRANKIDFEIFNLGNCHPEPLENLIFYIEKNLNKKAIKKFLDMQPGDVPATYADIDKTIKLLGFRPKTSLQEGIQKFIDWYRSYYFPYG